MTAHQDDHTPTGTIQPCPHLDSGADNQEVVNGLHKDVGLGRGQPHSHNRLLLTTVLYGHIVPGGRRRGHAYPNAHQYLPAVKTPEEESVVHRGPCAAQLGKDTAEADGLACVVAVEHKLRHLVEHGHARAQEGWPLW